MGIPAGNGEGEHGEEEAACFGENEAQQKETIRLKKEKEQFLRELKERLEMEKKKVRLICYKLEPDPC